MSDNNKSSLAKRSTCYLLNLKQPSKTAKRLKLSFQRTAGKLFIIKADRSVDAIVGYLDVSESGAGVFTTELLNKGTLVELYISEPAVLKVRGVVAWSVPITSAIYNGRFRFRSGIQFVYEVEAHQNAVKEFVEKVGKDPIQILKESGQLYPVPSGNNMDDPKPTQVGGAMPPQPSGTIPDSSAAPAEQAISATTPAATPPIEPPSSPVGEVAVAPVASSEAIPPPVSPPPVSEESTTSVASPPATETGDKPAAPEGGGQQAA